jgi:hypothetical protein
MRLLGIDFVLIIFILKIYNYIELDMIPKVNNYLQGILKNY